MISSKEVKSQEVSKESIETLVKKKKNSQLTNLKKKKKVSTFASEKEINNISLTLKRLGD